MKMVISKDGTTIAYDQTGQGTPLIMVGGAMSWRKFLAKQSHNVSMKVLAPALIEFFQAPQI